MTPGPTAWLNPLRAVYYVVGADGVLRQEAERALSDAVLGAAPDFNVERLSAERLPAETFDHSVRQLPVFAARRLVIVVDFDAGSAALKKSVARYADDPVVTTVLGLFAAKGERGDFAKKVAKHGLCVKCDPPSTRELASWIRVRAKAQGADVTASAAALLADLLGPDAGLIDQVVEQLRCYAASTAGDARLAARVEINDAHIEELVVATRSRTVFELIDAIGTGRADLALGVVAKLLEQREAPLMVLSMLARHVRQLLIARDAIENRASPASLASLLHVPPFVATNLRKQAERLSERALVTLLAELQRTDRSMKSGLADPELILERTVWDLTARVAGR